MKAALAIVAAVILSGCASVDLSNRVACSTDGARAWVVSQWGWLGVAADLHRSDAAAVCVQARRP